MSTLLTQYLDLIYTFNVMFIHLLSYHITHVHSTRLLYKLGCILEYCHQWDNERILLL